MPENVTKLDLATPAGSTEIARSVTNVTKLVILQETAKMNQLPVATDVMVRVISPKIALRVLICHPATIAENQDTLQEVVQKIAVWIEMILAITARDQDIFQEIVLKTLKLVTYVTSQVILRETVKKTITENSD